MYRSKQRGFLELDLVLGTWVEQHVHGMDEANIRALLQVLDLVSSQLCCLWCGRGRPIPLPLSCSRLSVVGIASAVEELR